MDEVLAIIRKALLAPSELKSFATVLNGKILHSVQNDTPD